MKKVKVKEWVKAADETGHYTAWVIQDAGFAEFLAWGVDYTDLGHGVGVSSTAIIKRDDGSVENVPCEMIQFVD